MVEFELKGLDELRKSLKRLPAKMQKKGLKSALGKAARVIRNAAKQNALRVDDPDTGRRIADNIVQRVRGRHTRRTGDLMVSVGVATERGRIPKGNPDDGAKGNTPHWHLIELGTEKMQAQPFLRPAVEGDAESSFDVFAEEVDRQVQKVLAEK
ncbi:HK97-gp10 family putative phage morphogenesis protein [Alcaligenes aquatilis]|uniref:HK97-gp10 family putative phage morphogenesis protein n=1 Tax=Alcaligenes aquatilis TaxID=323284 RepID=UPI003872DD0F